jgi:hypothetical protein
VGTGSLGSNRVQWQILIRKIMSIQFLKSSDSLYQLTNYTLLEGRSYAYKLVCRDSVVSIATD